MTIELPKMPEPAPDVAHAIKTAELWRLGKMIGGDEDDVRTKLLDEIYRLRAHGLSCYEAGVRAEREREVTPQMVEAALEVLREGGALCQELSCDRLTVKSAIVAAIAAAAIRKGE